MDDTICAISTAQGIGAISIIRVSGSEAIKIVQSIFSNEIKSKETHVIKYGKIIYNKEIIDEVLLMVMRSPKTYTKEDIVEINCHGGYNTTNMILRILLDKGCRLAEPGEFTKRAFLNGRINLLESEAVNDLIMAKTDSKRKLSLNQIGGKLTIKINEIRDMLLSLMANIEVNIDYPEYTDNLVITKKLLNEKLNEIAKYLSKLVKESEYGRIVSNGIMVAIVGKPNVGKSSILNSLLDEERAIVTDVAGTTRDIVEGVVSLNGIEVKLVDTAGIRETKDVVEKIGVEKSLEIIQKCDVILFVIDATTGITKEDKKILNKLDINKTIIFANKDDLKHKKIITNFEIVYGNAKTLDGLDNLKNKLIEKFNISEINRDLTYLSNSRQLDLIKKANDSLINGLNSLKNNIPIDMIETDLRACYEYLSEILGERYEEDLVNRLFKDFCVGK
ncbi:MAG: tRNA uridine-5-carboxymethylaminomethyl(34) synthesis GTPase MnmE [Mollicutes bacterium]|nr:tRNA uridine-5-carboxymethylaminomethyl(34) synthesis GTPase MnmE [Mollicutes bacterium]